MRTSTSIALREILLLCAEWGAASPDGEELLEPACDDGRHELLHISAEGGDLLHAARGDETDLRAGHHVHRLDLGGERAVQLVHLELPLEVGDHPQALHDHPRFPAA